MKQPCSGSEALIVPTFVYLSLSLEPLSVTSDRMIGSRTRLTELPSTTVPAETAVVSPLVDTLRVWPDVTVVLESMSLTVTDGVVP